jgi:hypothetical protein
VRAKAGKKAGKVVRAASAMALDARQSQRAYLQAPAAVQRCDAESRRWGLRGCAPVDTGTKILFEFPLRMRQVFGITHGCSLAIQTPRAGYAMPTTFACLIRYAAPTGRPWGLAKTTCGKPKTTRSACMSKQTPWVRSAYSRIAARGSRAPPSSASGAAPAPPASRRNRCIV